MKIYLAGSVPKGDKEAKTYDDWRIKYREQLKTSFDAEFVMPYHKNLDESDLLLVVGSDCKQIKESDLVVVNAEEKLGVGTAQELVIAKYFEKPVVAVLPKNTHHRRANVVFHGQNIEDWVHPFIDTFSDLIVESVEEIAGCKDQIAHIRPKNISIIDEAVRYFESKPPLNAKKELLTVKNYPGASGEFSFDHNGDVRKPIIIKQIQDGKFVKVSK